MTTPICTLDEIKIFGGIQSSNTDSVITAIMPGCMDAIGAFCNRKFESQEIIGFRNGNDGTGMMLANYPITNFASLVIDGQTIPKSVNRGAGYFVPPVGRRILLRGGYKFYRGDRNIELVYSAGFGDGSGAAGADVAPWPDDLKLAYMMFVLTRFKERTRLGVGTQSLGGESVTYTDATSGTSGSSQGIPSAARIVLENYVNTVPESGE